MLSKKIQKALNDQISREASAANYYLSMASWCDVKGLKGTASFMYRHADGERAHMMKLFRYVNDAGGHSIAPAIEAPEKEFKDIQKLFELVLKHEQSITQSINEVVELCLNEKDFSTFNFLQWYVAEQHEEERLFTQILDMIRIAGLEGRGLFLIDKEISKIGAAAE